MRSHACGESTAKRSRCRRGSGRRGKTRSENESVCRSLLSELVERALLLERARLFVIDGGKGIRKAIRGVFGVWALIQRCQVHKLRNVLEHLPGGQRGWVRTTLRRAWASLDEAAARRPTTPPLAFNANWDIALTSDDIHYPMAQQS